MLNEMFQDEPTKLQVEQVWITPERAAKLLESNTHNRGDKEKKVNQYAQDMLNGKWRLNGEAIKISKSGFIADGQNRLMACVKAGVAFETLIVFNVDDEAQEVMDTGAARSLNDVLKLREEAYSSNLSGAIRLSWRWDSELLMSKVSPTTSQALEWLRDNPRVREYVVSHWYQPIRKRTGTGLQIPPAVLSSFFYKTHPILPEEANFFHDELAYQDKTGRAHPINVYRARIQNVESQGEAVSDVDHLAYVIKAWNAFLKGEAPNQIRWKRGGAAPEAFPDLLLKVKE